MKPSRRLPLDGRRSAFTLIEVVISSTLMAMIVVSAYLCFSASIAGQKTMQPRLDIIQNARIALGLISADLRAACPLDKDAEFIGMHRMLGDTVADNLDFATHNYTPRHPNEGDFCETSYYIDADPDTGQLSLWRRRNPTLAPDPLSGGRKEEIAEGVAGFRLEYFDGLDWYDTWGDTEGRPHSESSEATAPNLSGLPEAVRITMWLNSGAARNTNATPAEANPEPPMVFQTIARINFTRPPTSGTAGEAPGPGAAPGGQPTQAGMPFGQPN